MCKTHGVLNEDKVSETLCHMQIELQAVLNGRPQCTSRKTGKRVRVVWAVSIADFDCKTCQIVWRNITRG